MALGRVRETIAAGTKRQPECKGKEEERAKLDLARLELLFVGKNWLSAAGTKYFFAADNTGYRLHGRDKTPLTWKISSSNILEAQGFMKVGEPATFFFKFRDEDHGILVASISSL